MFVCGFWQSRRCRHPVPSHYRFTEDRMMNDFTPSPELIAHVKLAEGLVLVPAPDPVGYVTYGWGHRAVAGEAVPPAITVEYAERLLETDLMRAGITVRQQVDVEMTQDQYDALCDFTFNLGSERFINSTMLRCINAGDWATAATECKKWVHAGGQVLPGLVTRRDWDAVRLDPSLDPAHPNKIVVDVPSILPPDPAAQAATIEATPEFQAALAQVQSDVTADEADVVHSDPPVFPLTPPAS
jgi:lysozyme